MQTTTTFGYRSGKLQKNVFKLLVSLSMITLLVACRHEPGHEKNEIIYIESNNYHANQNAIIAYARQPDGSMEQIPGSPFLTKGAGLANTAQILGPNDKETPEVIYNNKFLIAVNGGSNTIAVFDIHGNGTLNHVQGSPFPSGGENPVSIAISGNYLYVVNKSQDPQKKVSLLPNYTAFTIGGNGSLTPVPGSKFETSEGVSPSQVLISVNQKFAFGTDFLGFMSSPPKGTLRSFAIHSGILTPVAGTPYELPANDGGALGLWQHPDANVLYVGFPVAGKIGIYSISGNGQLSYRSSLTGGAATCWIRVTSDGKYMYTLNSAENTISVFNTINPLSPAFIQKFTLKQSGPLYPGPMAGQKFTTSEDFHLSFSKSEKMLYVVSQHTNVDFSIGNYNYLHALVIDNNGSLTEPAEPTQLPVDPDIRPEGVVVF
ncbi:MAG: hypothetical protein ABIQ31_15975 [Ferruginibacter sp.]